MRANSPLRLNEFAEPVLGLIFLKFAGVKHSKTEKEVAEERKKKAKPHGGASVSRERPVSSADYHARGVLFVPEKARFSYLIELPEGTDMGRAANDAMKEIEAENKELAGILPKTFQKLDNRSIIALLKNFNQIPDDIEGDAFGRIYEYFLGKFALADGSRGGEFFTPTSIVKLIVEIIEPYQGRIYDPACGSGGMFVQSHEFVKRHLENGKKLRASREIAIYGQEKTDQTVRIAKMNLAIHGLSGDIREGNTYYEDRHKSLGKFDFTMANPPFNVKGIDKERIKDDRRFSYGIPKADNGNYLWIQIFLNSLNDKGRAGFVMANSASDAGHSEKEIRQKMIEDGVVDVIVAVGPNMFYNVIVPVTLWFFDKDKKQSDRKDKILFVDAREISTSIPGDRARKYWTDEQIIKIADIVKSYRGEKGTKTYQDVKGLCRAVTLQEIRDAGYSLNPGQYVGILSPKNKVLPFEDRLGIIHRFLKEKTQLNQRLNEQIITNLKNYFRKFNWTETEFFSPEIIEHFLRLIYQEWLANFHFPGYENVKKVDSKTDFGKIPEGWEIKKLGDKFEVILGGTPSRSNPDYWNGSVSWINSGEVNRLRITSPTEFITKIGLDNSAAKLMPKRTTVLAITGATLGQVSMLEIECSANQSVVGVYDKNAAYNEYLYLYISDHIKDIISKSGGSAQQHINKAIVEEYSILIPPKEVIEKFNKIAKPAFDLLANLLFMSQYQYINKSFLPQNKPKS